VLAINLMPFLAPPTWMVLVFYKLNSNLNSFALIAIGVVAAASGRYRLARATRLIRHRLTPRYLANLSYVKDRLTTGNSSRVLYFVFFILSPLPSAQVFEAAALVDAPLLSITAAFMAGRIVSYSLSVFGASTLKEHGMSSIFLSSLTSPWGIALQLICLVAIYALMRVDWQGRFGHRDRENA